MSAMDKHTVIKVNPKDNVGIIVHPSGLPKGAELMDGTTLNDAIPMGHKVALQEIAAGGEVVRYGEVIGQARGMILRGDWVDHARIELLEPPEMDDIPFTKSSPKEPEPLEGYTFQGYKNSDGSVGTKNVLGITTSVQCVAGMTQYIVTKIKNELLPKYTNVDDVVALNHSYGCGVAINAPGAVIPIRTIQNITQNPNFGGEVMVIGLGCEKLRPQMLLPKAAENELGQPSNILYMQDEAFHGFSEMVDGIMKLAEDHLQKLNKRTRTTCPVSGLVVGMQCGGSDSFSGITGNPAAGFAADLIVRAGGSVMFSEVTEVRDAIHLLVPRTEDPIVADALKREMSWYDNYLTLGLVDRSANPSPGNKLGGLSNVVEKALGSVAKSGTSPIVDVIGPGEKIRKKGLSFAATPASDFVCGTLQLAAGMNLHVFITGRGTPYGLSMVPVVKVGTNTKLSKRWFDLIDVDAGPIATSEKTIAEVGWELFYFMLDVASGKKLVAADKLRLHNDLVLFNPGPVT